jgi:CRP-like cAMP-binding protein
MKNCEQIIKNISRHIKLNTNEIDFFTSLLQYKKLKRKEFLLRPDEICRHETFVTKGCLRTYHTDENGFEHILEFSIEDWWAEDLYSFLTNKPAKLCIDALEDTEVLRIEKTNLEKLYEKVPKFERFFRLSFQNAYIAQQERITFNLFSTAEGRYISFKNKYPLLRTKVSTKANCFIPWHYSGIFKYTSQKTCREVVFLIYIKFQQKASLLLCSLYFFKII